MLKFRKNAECNYMELITKKTLEEAFFINLLLKENLEDRFKFFYSLKIGIDYNIINIIPNNFSTFSYAVSKDGILYFIAGEIAGLDELEYSRDKGISNDIFTFYILSQIFKFSFKIQEKIKYHNNLYKYLSEYCFISEDEDIASFFYLNCIYAYTIKFLNEVKIFNTERIQKLLFHKGFIAPAFTNFIELQNNFLDVSKIIRYTRTKSFKKILDKDFTSQKFVKKTIKRADLYSFGQIKKINFPLKKILKESDCILLGEIHFCNNYYNFIGELLPFFVKYNYLNFYFELPASYSEIINNFFNNKISFPEDPLLLYLKVLFINLKKIKNETNKQIHIFCFDINIDNQLKINNYNEFLINRENQIIKNLQKNLNKTGKNLFF